MFQISVPPNCDEYFEGHGDGFNKGLNFKKGFWKILKEGIK